MSIENREKTKQYQAYEGKDKEERIEIATTDPLLERKRFILSDNPESRKQLSVIQEVTNQLVQTHPEVICLGLYGSQTKGCATDESDFDANLLIDTDKIPAEAINGTDDSRYVWYPRYGAGLVNELIESLKKQKILELDFHCSYALISQEKIDKVCTSVTDKKIFAFPFMELFYLSIGVDKMGHKRVNDYREKLFRVLEAAGTQGEKTWQLIMDKLCRWENLTFNEKFRAERRVLYPNTIAEGRRYFLSEKSSTDLN